MTQKHMDRLSAVDATFLHQESAETHMHVAGLVILEGPAPSYEDFLAHISSRLHAVPRYRQKLAMAPFQTGRPLWIDDPRFNLEYHVRHTGLPRPGSEEQLLRLAGRVAGQQLDRTKPLWELWFIEGLKDGRWALITKTHHSLIDGIAGVELLTVMFDLSPDYTPPAEDTKWVPNGEPSTPELLVAGVRDAVSMAVSTATRTASVLSSPSRLLKQARDALEGIGEVVWAQVNAAPPTPLNVPVGPHRRFAIARSKLSDYKLVKNAFGGTVNDVVLCVVAGAMARFLRERGISTSGLRLRALVPVSVRSEDKRKALGNQITVLVAPLPVDIDDPVERLAEVRRSMEGIKNSKQALGATVITGLQRFAPPTLLAVSSRMGMSSRLFNLLVTNVPGPQFPVYALGRRMLETFPIAFLAPDHALAIAIVSYDGAVNFGLLADFETMPDLDVVAAGIDEALAEIVGLARAALDAAGGGENGAAPAKAVSAGDSNGSQRTRRATGTGAAP